MKWSQAKTILIVFFILVDLFLLFYLASDQRSSRQAFDKVTQNTVEVLKNNGISVKKELILKEGKADSMKTAYVENIIKDYRDFAKLILGEDTQKKSDTHFVSENGEIKFSGDSFEVKAIKGELTLTKGIIDSSDAQKTAKELAELMGIDLKKASVSAKEENGKYIVKISQKINKCEIFGAGVELEFSKSGIKSIKGCWYNNGEGNNTAVKLKALAGALIEYMNSIKAVGKNLEITDISLGYKAGEGMTHHESLVLTPVWRITDNTGKSVYIDAREN